MDNFLDLIYRFLLTLISMMILIIFKTHILNAGEIQTFYVVSLTTLTIIVTILWRGVYNEHKNRTSKRTS